MLRCSTLSLEMPWWCWGQTFYAICNVLQEVMLGQHRPASQLPLVIVSMLWLKKQYPLPGIALVVLGPVHHEVVLGKATPVLHSASHHGGLASGLSQQQ